MGTLQKKEAICSTILNYGTQKKGVVDDKGLTELKSMGTKLGKYESLLLAAIDAASGARSRFALAYKGICSAMHVSRKALELVNARDGSATRVLSGDLREGRHTAKALDVAGNYQQALEAAGTDPVIASALATLKPAMDEYASAAADLKAKEQELAGLRGEVRQATNTMGVRLTGYARFITSSLPRAERDDLICRIRAVTAGGSHVQRQNGSVPQSGPVTQSVTTTNAGNSPAKTTVAA